MSTTNRPTADAGLLRECRYAFDRWQQFASSAWGWRLVLAWAFLEALVWPVIPDVLLVAMVAGQRRRFYVPLAAAITGSALGGTLLLIFAWANPGAARQMLDWLPLVSDAQAEEAGRRLV